MTAFLMFVHTTTCVLLIAVVLMQSGRGGGLTETFASAESMFGAKTNQMMVKMTTILAGIFLVTSLTLAYFSAKKDQSLVGSMMTGQDKEVQEITIPIPPVSPTTTPSPAAETTTP